MYINPVFILSLLLTFNVLTLACALLVLHFLQKETRRVKLYAKTPDARMLHEAKIRSQSILHRAIKQAQKIIVAAELRGINYISREKLDSGKLGRDFKTHMADLESQLEKKFAASSQGAQASYEQFLKDLEQKFMETQAKNQAFLEKKTEEISSKTQTSVDEFTQSINKNIETQIDRELAAVREDIEKYKLHRMKVINENIINIIEDIILIIFGIKLSLNDQSSLIYKSLDEAKREKALIS